MRGIRTCRCPDGYCFDLNIKCPECDEDGYPYTARRRLKRSGDGVFEDIDDGQKFKVKKTKTHTGNRLIPVFGTRVDWKGSNGFAAMALILSCLGTDGEYVMWNESTKQGMDVCEWKKRTYTSRSKVPVRHLKCGETTTTTRRTNLLQGHNVGCTCNSNHWRSRRSVIVALGQDRFFDVLTTEKEWIEECSGNDWKPKLLCIKCKDIVETTSICSLQEGHNVGCTCHSNQAKHWRDRRDEVVEWGKDRSFDVVTTEEEWVEECSGAHWHPKLLCLECKEIVETTSINSLQRGRDVGCTCHSAKANHWRDRRDEVVKWGKDRSFDVVTTEEEWVEECSGNDWKPKLLCIKCKDIVETTSIHSLQRGQGVGCKGCRNKTEAKLNTWIMRSFQGASIEWGTYKGPMLDGQTHFDFHLTFTNGFEVLIELDGAQHFWKNNHFYTEEGCKRDVDKEEWAIAQGLCVVRVLQEDVWDDKLSWQYFLKRNINAESAGLARVLKPDAPEYTSSESGYVRAHMRGANDNPTIMIN